MKRPRAPYAEGTLLSSFVCMSQNFTTWEIHALRLNQGQEITLRAASMTSPLPMFMK